MNTDPALRSKDRSPAGLRAGVKITAKVLIALVAINCNLATGFTAPANAAPITTASAPGLLSLSTPSVMKLLAADGVVTVANELTTAPLVPVGKPVGLQFTQAQAASLAGGAAGGDGITGAALDASVPVGQGAPPFSYLLAAWASTGTSPGAATVRAMYGPQDWGRAPDLVFPTIALALFTADVVNAAGAQTAGTSVADDRAVDPALARAPAHGHGPVRLALHDRH